MREHLIESKFDVFMIPPKILDSVPPHWFYPFSLIIEMPVYPTPTTWLVEKGVFTKRETTEMETRVRFSKMVDVRPMNRPYIEHVLRKIPQQDLTQTHGYHLKINFNKHKNEELVRAFAFWLKGEAKRKREVALHGRASAPRWHRLKQLAAKRLSKLGLNYKDAMRKIDAHQAWKPNPTDKNSVLPKYNSQGAWSDAIKSANDFIEMMKENSYLEGWELR